ncbi:MAG: restriction endonuclease [Anaerolineales bacterium]|nr:restriction endonuclease [Anaerolineales bacterium]MDP2777786.1 restriction endonuclease [Anaerolineales bacterium]
MHTNPDWKEYENLVCEAMKQENPDLKIERDIKLHGHISETKRQIDIAAKGRIAGHNVFVVIDCKKYSSKLDVNDVGSFITFLNDVGADIGILVTQKGFSESAKNLAKKSRVKLEIKTLEELREYKITFDYCEECDRGEDHFPGVIRWTGFEGLAGDINKVKEAGHCDWCGSLHIRCQDCNTITGIPETLYQKSVECLGRCGIIFRVNLEYVGHGMNDFVLIVKNNDIE